MRTFAASSLTRALAALSLAVFPVSPQAQDDLHEEDVAQSVEVVGAAAVTSARAAGSAEYDKAKDEAPAYLFEVGYKGDYLRGTSGAAKDKHAYMGNLDLNLTVNGDKAFNWQGSTLFVHLLQNHGGRINDHVGAQQGVSNIEVPVASRKVHQLWWQQQFLDDKVSVLGGLYDLNSEFYVTDSSGVFIHPSFGIGTDIAQTGENGPAIFPNSALGLRLRTDLAALFYAQAVILDGVAGNPNRPKGTHIRINGNEGALVVAELGLQRIEDDKVTTKFGVGVWQYSKEVDDQSDVDANGDPVKRTNDGIYALVEQQLFKHKDGRRLMGFARYGTANKDVNAIKDNLVAGLTYEGPLASRPDDVIGLGVSRISFGQKAQDVALASGTDPAIKSETAYELTYQAKLTEWLNVQPEVQYVRTVSNPARDKDVIVGIRFEVALSW